METPVCDFVRRYAKSGALRLHMPGHKGSGALGVEQLDITEIPGADSLFEASGILRQSEENAGALFGARTFYSTEGSSLCIRAMLYLAVLHARQQGKRPRIAAFRNAHKAFLSAAALLDLQILWLYPEKQSSYLSCELDGEDLAAALSRNGEMPTAVYLTSPDYLGNLTDIASVARFCHEKGILLLVDNAHGAYLRFLQPSRHPMDLGADMCCDSAHKTLPVLTGGAYLHISHGAPKILADQAKNALALFGSTSPSYLILQSLDAANAYLADGYTRELGAFAARVAALKDRLTEHGFCLRGAEPLKLTVETKAFGYTGIQLGEVLRSKGIECEFCDPDFLVLMLTPETGEAGLERLEQALLTIPRKSALAEKPPVFRPCRQVMSVREATLSPCETVAAKDCVGRVLAAPCVGCPPAVPIVVCGERMDEETAKCFGYYGIQSCAVVLE